MENKQSLINSMLAIGLLMGFVFIVSSSIYFIRDQYGLSCSCKSSVPIAIASLASLGVFVGVLTFYFLSKSFAKQEEQMKGNVHKTLNFLDPDEKKILQHIINEKGHITQSALAKSTTINPVKLHRRLQNLKRKGIITQEKKGMTKTIQLSEEYRHIFM